MYWPVLGREWHIRSAAYAGLGAEVGLGMSMPIISCRNVDVAAAKGKKGNPQDEVSGRATSAVRGLSSELVDSTSVG